MTRVKICGITREADAIDAAQAGADAIGLVFYSGSARHVTLAQAKRICAALPPFVSTVALFVNAPAEEIAAVLGEIPVDLLQFHGDETPPECARFGKPFLRAVRMKQGSDLLQCAADFSAGRGLLLRGLLLDAYVAGQAGGTGTTFDWHSVPPKLPLPVVLSGGLTADNVTVAIKTVRPWAVDVSSGVESAPGIKDAARIREFIKGVRNADG